MNILLGVRRALRVIVGIVIVDEVVCELLVIVARFRVAEVLLGIEVLVAVFAGAARPIDLAFTVGSFQAPLFAVSLVRHLDLDSTHFENVTVLVAAALVLGALLLKDQVVPALSATLFDVFHQFVVDLNRLGVAHLLGAIVQLEHS